MELQMDGQFEAKDVRGKKYTIHIFRPVMDPSEDDLTRSHAVSNLGSLRTSDGDHVHWLAQGSYDIVREDGRKVRVTSEDPDAP